MPNYVGFSTIAANRPKTNNPPPGKYGGPGSITDSLISGKKFRMTDQALVIQDFLNAVNIKQGQKVGQPEYGSRLWDFVFEPNDTTTQEDVETELRRIISQDPRLQVGTIRVYPQDNGILVELQLAVYPFNQTELLSVFFNSRTGAASV